jgi:hypothetical protein
LIDRPSDNALRYFVGWIMKLQTKHTAFKKIEVMRVCLFDRDHFAMHKQGLLLARQIIREDPELEERGAASVHNALQ